MLKLAHKVSNISKNELSIFKNERMASNLASRTLKLTAPLKSSFFSSVKIIVYCILEMTTALRLLVCPYIPPFIFQFLCSEKPDMLDNMPSSVASMSKYPLGSKLIPSVYLE